MLMLSFINMVKIYTKGKISFQNYQNLKFIILERHSIDRTGVGSTVWFYLLMDNMRFVPSSPKLLPRPEVSLHLIHLLESWRKEKDRWVQNATIVSDSFSYPQMTYACVCLLLNFFHLSIFQSILSSLRARTKRHDWHKKESVLLNVKRIKIISSREITVHCSSVTDKM